MSITENGTDLVMPVAPMNNNGGYAGYPYPVYMGNGGGNNGGFGDGNGWWFIILIILLAAGGWNNGNNNGGGFGAPYVINTDNAVQEGFNQAAIMGSLNDITAAICNGFSTAEVSDNARQIANMQQGFATQTAITQGINSLASQFADCCCENRLASADLRYTIATENCADRYEAAQNTRDIIENCNRNNQVVLDKLCQLELDAKNDRISELERQLSDARFNASQIAQTAEIQRGQVAEVDALYNRLATCPVGTMPVYGNQPIFTCGGNNNGCGCGNNF